MADVATAVNSLVDRLSNRLIWALGHKSRNVETQTPIVSFTFDDVPDSAHTNGAAILEKYGARGTFYISGGLESRIEPDRTLISRAGCLDLFRKGHEIGNHTFSHDRIRSLNLADDLDRNGDYLRKAGIPGTATSFAFPYNAAWPPARRELAKRYLTCRGAGQAINRGPTDPLMLKAVEIRQPEESARQLTRWIDDVVENPGWLIFFTHDIADKATAYGCMPETFEHLVRHASESGCRIMTVEAAAKALGWSEQAAMPSTLAARQAMP